MITTAELGGLVLFESLTAGPVGRTARGRRGGRVRPGARSLAGGRARRRLVGPARGPNRPGAARGPGGHRVRPPGRPRALGRGVPRLGRGWGLPHHRAHGQPGACDAGAGECAPGAGSLLVPVRRPHHRRGLLHGAQHRGGCPPAWGPGHAGDPGGGPGPRAEQPGRSLCPSRRCARGRKRGSALRAARARAVRPVRPAVQRPGRAAQGDPGSRRPGRRPDGRRPRGRAPGMARGSRPGARLGGVPCPGGSRAGHGLVPAGPRRGGGGGARPW